MTPIKMIPAFQNYLWGGTRLIEEYGKDTHLRPVAESWELSVHPDGKSVAANGQWRGMTLAEIIMDNPELTGTRCANGEFPILIKLIDASKDLSVQVHPDNEYAQLVESQSGKNEVWYVLDALPDSLMLLGCKRDISQDELRQYIENGSLPDVMVRVPVRVGDCYSIPAGMLHAIGAGVLVAEIQQCSNLTYRVYDYGRKGEDGKQRELHIDKALEVTDTTLRPIPAPKIQHKSSGFSVRRLTNWEYFSAFLFDIHDMVALCCGAESFHSLIALDTGLTLISDNEQMTLRKGDTIWIPANSGKYQISGIGQAILVSM